MRSFKVFIQNDSSDCGVACVRMIAYHFGKNYQLHELKEKCFPGKDGISLLELKILADEININATGHQIGIESLKSGIELPCILHWDQNHFVVLHHISSKGIIKWRGVRRGVFHIADPIIGKVKYEQVEFEKHWLATDKSGSKRGIVLDFEKPLISDFDKSVKQKHDFRSLIRKYLPPHKSRIFKLLIVLLIGSLFQFAAPFITQLVVDKGIGQKNLNFVMLALIGQIVLILSRATVDFYRNWLLLHINTRIDISLISDFLAKLMKLPVRFFESKMVGDIMQRIVDHTRIHTFLTGPSINIIFSFINLIVFAFILSIYNWRILVVFIVFSLLYFVWVWFFLKSRRKIDYQNFLLLAANQSKILQIINGMQEIKLNNCEEQLKSKWYNIQNELYETNIESLRLNQYQSGGAMLINEIKNVLITFISAYSVINGSITLGMMMSIQYIIGQLNSPVEQMINFIQSAQDAKISLERLEEVHLHKNEEDENEVIKNAIISNSDINLQNLTFRYNVKNGPNVLSNINLLIPKGKTTAIIGSSGSGKTTLIKLLLGFYQPNEGEILVGNTPLRNLNINKWRSNCGTVLQDGFIFSDTIKFNITLNDSIIDKVKVDKALFIANISGFVQDLPLGLNTRIGSEGIGFSEGQKQRLLIARSVYKDPEFLFFDEATNSLDAENERVIMKRLQIFFNSERRDSNDRLELKNKRTVIVVAHRLSTVRKADQIVVLEKGQIVEIGNHSELIKKNGRYFELIKDQLELND